MQHITLSLRYSSRSSDDDGIDYGSSMLHSLMMIEGKSEAMDVDERFCDASDDGVNDVQKTLLVFYKGHP